jgi:Family of unknown function (DUF6152)
MRYKALAGSIALAGSVLATTALAHHSFSMFDTSKEVVISGVVREVQWGNPHIWVVVTVPGADGSSTTWSFEGASPGSLIRVGWKPDAVAVGDKVVVTAHPLKNGEHGGGLLSVKLPNGSVLGRAQPKTY